jgi:diphosphomevalonate decarboxylase
MAGGETTARANVNVALVKYWGKRDSALNLPATGSISLTLDGLWVDATCGFSDTGSESCVIDGDVGPSDDHARVMRFVDVVRREAQVQAAANVRTTSGVPKGVGLASSAAAFAALALGTSRAAGLRLEPPALSALARRGSGSAARSIFGGFVEWRRGTRPDGLDSIAEPLLDPAAWDVRMVVAVTSTTRKAVGSSEGMRRATTSPLYPAWVETAERDLADARAAIARRDLEALGIVTEHSAFKMHAIGLAAQPPLLYWRGATVECIHRVWALRAEGTTGFVTIDAGPQVKVLCEASAADRIAAALRDVPGVERVLTCAPGGPVEARA